MKRTNLIYWIFTGLFSALMLFSAIPDVMVTEETKAFMSDTLGYPDYFTPFIGVAKILGVIGILIPRFPRITEWAYAGLAFDLIGATFSMYSLNTPLVNMSFMILPISLGIVSYVYYHKKLKHVVSSVH